MLKFVLLLLEEKLISSFIINIIMFFFEIFCSIYYLYIYILKISPKIVSSLLPLFFPFDRLSLVSPCFALKKYLSPTSLLWLLSPCRILGVSVTRAFETCPAVSLPYSYPKGIQYRHSIHFGVSVLHSFSPIDRYSINSFLFYSLPSRTQFQLTFS